MPKPAPYKYRLFFLLFFVIIFIIGIPILIFYSAGYTFDRTLGVLSPRGGIYVYTPESGTSVFVGNELKNVSSFFKHEILVDGLKGGQYLVLAANDNDWPWAKLVTVKTGEVEALFPIMVPKVVADTQIKSTEANFLLAERLFATTTTESSVFLAATSTITNTIARKKVEAWLDSNNIYAEWQGSNDAAPHYYCDDANVCTQPVPVFPSVLPIRHIDFYPARNDAIILALDNGIYAVEIDRRPYQNFYPLYHGDAPDFRVSGNLVFVKDKGVYSTLNLEK